MSIEAVLLLVPQALPMSRLMAGPVTVLMKSLVMLLVPMCIDPNVIPLGLARGKIDNLVHIGHNTVIKWDYSAAQTGVSGSARIGKGVLLADKLEFPIMRIGRWRSGGCKSGAWSASVWHGLFWNWLAQGSSI